MYIFSLLYCWTKMIVNIFDHKSRLHFSVWYKVNYKKNKWKYFSILNKLFVHWVMYNQKNWVENYRLILWWLTTLIITLSKQKTNWKYCYIFLVVESTSWNISAFILFIRAEFYLDMEITKNWFLIIPTNCFD